MSLTNKAIYANCVHKPNGCRLWKGCQTSKGYPLVHDPAQYARGGAGTVSGRRAVWERAFGLIKPGHVIVMTCRNRECLSSSHMVEVTKGQSLSMAATTGSYKSLRCKVSKIAQGVRLRVVAPETAQSIRARVLAGEKRRALAVEHGIHRSTVDNIMRPGRYTTTLAPNASVFHMAAAA